MRTAYRTCPLCDAVCGLKLTLDDSGRVTSVKGDTDDPFSKGYICPKGASLGKLDEDPDRLRSPMVRRDGEWHKVTWDEAFAVVDEGLRRVIDTYGRESLGIYLGNPTFHTMGGILYRYPLAMALGSRNVYSVSSIDQIPKQVACGHLYGNAMAIPVPDIDRTDHLLILGGNPLVSHGSLCAAPDFAARLDALRERGGRLVVVDPRRTRTAEAADEHIFIRPGTDPLFLFGIVHTLFAEGLTSVNVEVNGLVELEELAKEFAPEVVAPLCGVPADVIISQARALAAAPTAAVYARVGTSTVEFGTIASWLVDVVNVLTGNLDRPGGAMFTEPATFEFWASPEPYTDGRWHSRVKGLPEVLNEFPTATLADEMETPGKGQVKALISVAGNIVLSAPNGPRLDRALAELDFMVCVDPYLNETTKHAHVILPPPRIMQMPHYDFMLLNVTVRNYARYSPALLPLDPDQMSEADILARLTMIASGAPDADPSAVTEGFLSGMIGAAVQIPGNPVEGQDPAVVRAGLQGDSGAEQLLDATLKLGPYDLSLEKLAAQPHGVDLGALRPRLAQQLRTRSGRVELLPQPLLNDVDRLRARAAQPVPEFLLIGRRQLRSLNSWLHNVPGLMGGSNRCTLHVNPADVARLGLGAQAVVRSAVGELVVEVEASDTIMPGVVSLPHGWGHQGTPQSFAAGVSGVNANALTDDNVIDVLSGNAVFNGVPVTVASV